MNSQDIRNLQEAYLDVYRELDEEWKPVDVTKVKSRMGDLEGRLSSVSNDRINTTPEYARYQRTADVVAQSTRNPNNPFQKPTFDPGGMKIKPEGGVTSSPERNSQWQPFSSRLPTSPWVRALTRSPSLPAPSSVSVKPENQSTPSSTTPKPRSISGSSAPRPGRGSTSNWMTDRMSEYRSALRNQSNPTPKSQVKLTKSLRGGSGSAQNTSSQINTGITGYQVGNQVPTQGFGLQNIRLANSYEPDLFDVILEYLITEGYVDTEDSALVIMANMSEDWRDSIVEDIAGNQYTSNPIGNIIKTGAGLVKRVLNGTGPVKRDEPLWDGPETPTKPPVPTGGPKLIPRDEPLWDGPNKWETPTKPPVPKGGPKLRDEPLF